MVVGDHPLSPPSLLPYLYSFIPLKWNCTFKKTTGKPPNPVDSHAFSQASGQSGLRGCQCPGRIQHHFRQPQPFLVPVPAVAGSTVAEILQ